MSVKIFCLPRYYALFICFAAISACTSVAPDSPNDTAGKQTYSNFRLPGPSIANDSVDIMTKTLNRIQKEVIKENGCPKPQIYKVLQLEWEPWEFKDQSIVLKGPVFERWRVLACGLYLEFYILIKPTDLQKEGYVVGVSFRPSVPFEIKPSP